MRYEHETQASAVSSGGLLDGVVEDRERLLDELAHGVRLARCENEVLRALLLQHAPHALHVVSS